MTALKAALEYWSQGYCPVPLAPRGKRPIVSWGQYQKSFPKREKVRRMFSRAPESNIGVLTGRRYNLLVLDLDGPAGNQSVRGLCLPITRVVETGKGFHLWYRFRPGHDLGCAAGMLPGVDVRGNGGLVVAPPSVHANGRRYQVLYDETLALAPAWLKDAFEAHRKSSSTLTIEERRPSETPASLVRTRPNQTIPVGSRNWNVFRAACGFARSSSTFEHHLKRVRGMVRSCCEAPLGDNETLGIALHSWARRFSQGYDGVTATAYTSLERHNSSYYMGRRKWKS